MVNRKPDSDSSNRRSFLKATGLMATATSLPTGLVSASNDASDRQNLYDRSLFLRAKHDWDVDEWRKYLLKHGAEFKWKDTRIEVPQKVVEGKTESEGGPSTEYLNRKYLDLHVTYNIGYHYHDSLPRIDVDWEFNVTGDYPNAWGEDPMDMIQIHWGSEDYNIASDKQYYIGDYCADPSYRGVDSVGNNGMIAEWDDYAATYEYRPTDVTYDVSGSCGTALHPESDEDASDRSFSIDYKAFWSNVDLDWSFTVGYPSVSASNSTYSWVANFQALQDQLYDTRTKDYESEPGT